MSEFRAWVIAVSFAGMGASFGGAPQLVGYICAAVFGLAVLDYVVKGP